MNKKLVEQEINKYLNNLEKNGTKQEELKEREERKQYFALYDKERILNMSESEFDEYINKTWTFQSDHRNLIKIKNNGFSKVKQNIAYLLYGEDSIEARWDKVNNEIKGIGSGLMSELLCYIYPDKYSIFNNKTKSIFKKFEIKIGSNVNGKTYLEACDCAKEIGKMISEKTNEPCDLLLVDYFLFEISQNEPDILDSESTNSEKIMPEIYQDDSLIEDIIYVLGKKKNIILTGTPGVGKTHVAFDIIKLLELKKEKNINDLNSRITFTQFHQNYGYEEFVEGVTLNNNTLELKDGIFKKLVGNALKNPDKNYYIIIDEINRGNISKIFGELLMCIENDKRCEKYGVSLMHQNDKSNDNKLFYVPANVYIIGTMNTADRSLEPIDYALRRRFSFFHLNDAYNNYKFKKLFEENPLKNQIFDTMNHINNILSEYFESDNFNIGHSYFVNKYTIDENDFRIILKYDIIPLLKEYMIDCNSSEIKNKFNKTDNQNLKLFNKLLEELDGSKK